MASLVIPNAFIRDPMVLEPSLVTWSRLEPLPMTAAFRPGLEARSAGPPWWPLRQWQMNGLQGEDAGTPVDVRLTGEIAPLSRYAAGRLDETAAGRAVDYQSLREPLETAIEKEPVRETHPRLAAEAGLHLVRL